MDAFLALLPPDIPATALPAAVPPNLPPPQPVLVPPSAAGRAQAWRDMLLGAYQSPYITLRLAEQVIEVDKQDVDLQYAATYRQSLSPKDLEQTAGVLHLISREVKLALMACDFNQLSALPSLPEQLTEQLADDAADHTDKDAHKLRRPIIYMHFHVDDNGVPPTIDEYSRIADAVKVYVDYATAISQKKTPKPSDQIVAHQIEQAVLAPPNKGIRAQYRPIVGEARYGTSETMLAGLRQFLAVRFAQVSETPVHRRGRPVKHAVTEVGWTVDPNAQRFKHFEHGESSNKLMNVIDAATRYVLPAQSYRMRWIIVMETIRWDLSGPAERTISRLTSSYTTSGGTNQILAGLSVDSSYKLPSQTWLKQCNDLGYSMLNSVTHDKDILEADLAQRRQAKSTMDQRKRLTEVQTAFEDTRKEVAAQDEEKVSHERKLENAAGPWVEMVQAELQAIKKHERMVQLALRLKDLL